MNESENKETEQKETKEKKSSGTAFKAFFAERIGKHFWPKFILMVLGTIFLGGSIGILVEAGWGTDPYSFLNQNVSFRLHLSIGTWQFLLNATLFVFMLFCGRKHISFGTVINMVLVGYTVDFTLWIFSLIHFDTLIQGNFVLRIIAFIFGIILLVTSIAVYANSEMGLAPYDATIKIISDWIPKFPYSIFRIIFEFLIIGTGFLVNFRSESGVQGSAIGATIVALLLGPAISFTGRFMKKHIKIFQE